MKHSSVSRHIIASVLLSLLLPIPSEAKKKKVEAPVPLTEAGETHLAEYTAKLEALKAELRKKR